MERCRLHWGHVSRMYVGTSLGYSLTIHNYIGEPHL